LALNAKLLDALFLWGFALLIILVYIGLHHLAPKISVSDEGISAYAFRRRSKFIGWQEVTKIKKKRQFDISLGRIKTLYAINSKSRWKFILFDEQIVRLDDLLRRLNNYAREYNIELVSIDPGNDGSFAKSRNPTVKMSWWRARLQMDDDIEVRISEL
jgi:hypothetical protein